MFDLARLHAAARAEEVWVRGEGARRCCCGGIWRFPEGSTAWALFRDQLTGVIAASDLLSVPACPDPSAGSPPASA